MSECTICEVLDDQYGQDVAEHPKAELILETSKEMREETGHWPACWIHRGHLAEDAIPEPQEKPDENPLAPDLSNLVPGEGLNRTTVEAENDNVKIRVRVDAEIETMDGELEERSFDVESRGALVCVSMPMPAGKSDEEFAAVSYFGAADGVVPFLASIMMWGAEAGELGQATRDAVGFSPKIAGGLLAGLYRAGLLTEEWVQAVRDAEAAGATGGFEA